MVQMIGLEAAQNLLLGSLSPLQPERIPLALSVGRALAENITASVAVPPFDRSPLDGYALQAEDIQSNLPVTLRLAGEIPAGTYSAQPLLAGTAVRILTGSPLPPGANAVIRQEDTRVENGLVYVYRSILPGSGISRSGEDIQAGEPLLRSGLTITPAMLGVIASQGQDTVLVFRQPHVALASTGDELIELGNVLALGQIYNTNMYTLAGLIETWGGLTQRLGIVRDRAEALAHVFEQGLAQADILVTTGGASVGTYDITEEAMHLAGAEVLFNRVAVKPGTPVICARKGTKLILGLSGNPAAAMISAAVLLGPLVRKMAGFSACLPQQVTVKSLHAFHKKSGIRRLIRATVSESAGELIAKMPEQQQPGVLKSMLITNALLDLAPDTCLVAGQSCKAFLLDKWRE
ncbi:MAG: molybdopterin molybdotransferase MoeA [Peptococcaceae bacterium]|nr:molybdopterin molybdotransferase MoeA [Peptococcaceae bacterium]